MLHGHFVVVGGLLAVVGALKTFWYLGFAFSIFFCGSDVQGFFSFYGNCQIDMGFGGFRLLLSHSASEFGSFTTSSPTSSLLLFWSEAQLSLEEELSSFPEEAAQSTERPIQSRSTPVLCSQSS